ncbi:7161_t:CDS:2 [Entrophospora sp. SA101]|nr:7161_t:CDS:2 [Entrophospora sp. SA101]CAJ0897501.1 4268_t:CDS:2 [Entrophospora sp. SA101]CAJ0897538.1 4272_t:CDS:2 [Entrophospora sp. SA101]CAJ0897574.1 4276_t:CDS:2 [Entrophospora sp. SA101]
MTKQTFLDAIAIGNVFPSSLVMFSTFIGYKGGYVYGGVGYGFLGVVLITIGIFTPCRVVGIIAVTAFDLLKASITTSASLVLYLPGLKEICFDVGSAKSSGSDIVTLRKKRRRGGCNEELKLLLDLEPSPNSVTAIY